VYILIEEKVERDGSGQVCLLSWVESSTTEDVANLDRAVRLFLAESDEVLEKFFSELPFTREEFDIGGKLLVKHGSMVMEQSREETADFQTLVAKSASLSERQMRKPPYEFKVALNEALDHQLKMASKSTNEIMKVALAQLRALHLKTVRILFEPFPLHDGDTEIRQALNPSSVNQETLLQVVQLSRVSARRSAVFRG